MLREAPAGRRRSALPGGQRAQAEEGRAQATPAALREQAFEALGALLRGVREADVASGGELLRPWRGAGLRRVYRGLVAALLRLVFVLFAEARGMLPARDARHAERDSLTGLHAWLARERGEALDRRHGAWARVLALLGAVRGGEVPGRGGALVEPGAFPPLALSDGAVLRALDPLLRRGHQALDYGALDVELLGSIYEELVGFEIERSGDGALGLRPGEQRRRSGSHYTPRSLTRSIVERTLGPLLEPAPRSPPPTAEQILALRVCDPAMGSGAFVLEACRQLAGRLVEAWRRSGEGPGDDPLRRARGLVAQRCLYGVDKDPLAVELARRSLWLLVEEGERPFDFVDHALCHGDSLAGLGEAPKKSARRGGVFRWSSGFSGVFDRPNPGFDGFVGNPPWVSYAGRAAQPLPAAARRYYEAQFEAFAGYKNLQGLFVELCARLLRVSGRMGLVIPSSMAELSGYAPTRLAHDARCVCDGQLPDLGTDAFEGVFQPCMALLSTRRAQPADAARAPWPVERPDLDPQARQMLRKMTAAPLPPSLFGERGLQTCRNDEAHLALARGDACGVPLRTGSDIRAFVRGAPSLLADASWFGGRLRPAQSWQEVRVLIRQTARFPIAVASDGVGFRNSILAGFEDAEHPADFLVAYLNSAPIRWFHYMSRRDARQGMPQMKVGHLRSLPAPPRPSVVAELASLGAALSARNQGIDEASQAAIDRVVAEGFGLTRQELARVRGWMRSVKA